MCHGWWSEAIYQLEVRITQCSDQPQKCAQRFLTCHSCSCKKLYFAVPLQGRLNFGQPELCIQFKNNLKNDATGTCDHVADIKYKSCGIYR